MLARTPLWLGFLLFVCTACVGKISNEKLEDLIKSMFKEQLSLETSAIDCPKDVKVEPGKTFECDVTVKPAGKIPVVVKMTDDTGSVEAETKYAVLLPEKLADEVVRGMAAQNIQAKVDCGKEVRLKKPGSHYTCTATPPAGGQSRVVNIDVSDDGNVAWKIE
jgi:hypothetical protein